MNRVIFISLAVFFLFSNFDTNAPEHKPLHDLGYHFDEPDQTFEMPASLREISGLSISPDGKSLLCVNDEQGIIFFINKQTGEVEKEISFHKEGDYEGIEAVGNEVFVVKSTGTIYEVKNLGEANQEMVKHKFFLTKEHDVEGLTYDARNDQLWLGCKGSSASDEMKMEKSVFAFDLKTRTLLEQPALNITAHNCHHYLGICEIEKDLDKLKDIFSLENDEFKFNPSALAIHPSTGEIFVTSSKGKTLLVLNTNGEIIHIEKLKKSLHPQPEGLCFDEDGTLYISNEGKKGIPATIMKFEYHKS